MQYRISHTTTFNYSESVPLGHSLAHLTPRNYERQRCLQSELTIDPRAVAVHNSLDCFGNNFVYFTVEQEHRQLSITAHSEVEVVAAVPPVSAQSAPWEGVVEMLHDPSDWVQRSAAQFRFASPRVVCDDAGLDDYARQSFSAGRPLIEAAVELMQRIHADFAYDPSATSVDTPVAEVFRQRRGVCQDFAHLQIAALRGLGLAARYVSGYLLTEPPPGQPKLIGADASHAWLSIYCPLAGWVDLDPTNNLIPELRHVTLAWGRDYGDVCPVRGVFLGGGQAAMSVMVDVVPVDKLCVEGS